MHKLVKEQGQNKKITNKLTIHKYMKKQYKSITTAATLVETENTINEQTSLSKKITRRTEDRHQIKMTRHESYG